MAKWIRWMFEPVIEAFELDKMLENSPQMLIECGKLESYEEDNND